MKKNLFFPFSLMLIFLSTHAAFAQVSSQYPAQTTGQAVGSSSSESQNALIQEMQQADPQTTQLFLAAIQKGDFATARAIYQEFRKKQTASEKKMKPGAPGVVEERQEPSLFERTLSGDFPKDILSAGLQQFGYDIFLKATSSFSSSTNIPVGPEYIIGPGDQFTLTLWGTTEGIFTFTVSKEGNITLPKVGVVPVTGVRFGELEKTLKRHLSRYYRDFNVSIAMGSIKTITVYVVGEVASPGSYSVTSLATIYNALFSAGGPTKKGTLRSIQVLRAGKVIKTIDLYDFLLRGDRSQDIKLQHEDTVFVPIIGPIAGVAGSVYRPAIYELKGKETIGDVIQTAGGIMPIALASRVQLYRFAGNEKKVILDISVSDPPESPASANNAPTNELQEKVSNMDVINVLPIYDKVWEKVSLSGDVQHPGNFQWRQDLKLNEIIQEGQLLPTADLKKVEIIRLTDDYKDRTIIPINLTSLMNGDESQNMLLRPQDQISVYTLFREAERVTLTGEVMIPGVYEIHRGDRLSDLLRRVGGFTQEAYPYGIVYKRKDVKNTQDKNLQAFSNKMQSQVLQTAAGGISNAISGEEATFAKAQLSINQSILDNLKNMQEQSEGRVAINITEHIDEWAGSKDDLLLKDGDMITVPKQPQEVMLMGEVHSPGAQIYLPNSTVKEYINLSGGYTDFAEKDQVFVVQANGFAFSSSSPSVDNIEKVKLNAGDTIFVPQKSDRYATMRSTKDIIDILFKTAVVIATITILF